MNNGLLEDTLIAQAPTREVRKGDLLLRSGDVSGTIFYVLKGCLRGYIIDRKGKEHIFIFAPEDWIISDHEAVLNNVPATFNIDAVEDSVIKVMKRPANIQLSDLDKSVLVTMNRKFQKRILTLQLRVIQLLSATAEERYNAFTDTYPSLAQRLPLKMIASYLGITPEGLSRVRKNITKNKIIS